MLGAWGRVRGRLGLGIRSVGLLSTVLGRETWEGVPKDHQRAFRGYRGRRPYCCLKPGTPAVTSTGVWACRPRGAKMWEVLASTGSARAGVVERNARVREFRGLPAAPLAQLSGW